MEGKGRRDSLSDNQIVWLNTLATPGLDAVEGGSVHPSGAQHAAAVGHVVGTESEMRAIAESQAHTNCMLGYVA